MIQRVATAGMLAALPALVALLLLAPVAVPAHGQADGEVEMLAEELRRLREEATEANRLSWMLFLVSFGVGMGIAVAAVVVTVWNGVQLRRHVNLVKRDMDERLRPYLGWTTDENLLLYPKDVDSGGVFRIKIVNAGRVAARGIVCHMKLGMTSDFETGSIRHERECRGSLAPDMFIEVRVPITTEQMRAANQQNQFHAEILIEYLGPGETAYKYSMSGDYDGTSARWRD